MGGFGRAETNNSLSVGGANEGEVAVNKKLSQLMGELWQRGGRRGRLVKIRRTRKRENY